MGNSLLKSDSLLPATPTSDAFKRDSGKRWQIAIVLLEEGQMDGPLSELDSENRFCWNNKVFPEQRFA